MDNPIIQDTERLIHLHLHTEASRDGLGTIERLVAAAAQKGIDTLAVTDHGSLAAAITFTKTCHEYGIRPLIGYEAYVTLPGDQERYHLTLLADGNTGFNTLVHLNNLGQGGDDAKRPSFPLFALKEHHDGLVVLTGCPASPFQALPWGDAKDLAMQVKGWLGANFMAEVMLVAQANPPWERAAKLAKDLHLAPVLTNDAHFPYAEDAPVHKILSKFRMGFEYESANLFLASADELRQRALAIAPNYRGLIEAGIKNANALGDRLATVQFDATPKLPHIPNADSELWSMTLGKLVDLQHEFPGAFGVDYEKRLSEELAIIKDMGFSSYFLILADIVRYARSVDCRVGPGRGSGAGSLAVFLLGITEIDPIQYGLSFDRFLNRKRKEMPDIDTDFEAERRDLVIEYAKTRWGAIPVATYSRWTYKSLIHDLCRLWRIPRDVDDAAADAGPDSAEFDRLMTRAPGMREAFEAMSDQIRHIGQHAAGVVIVDATMPVPLERTASGSLVAGWVEGEHRELTVAGIVKFDLLGLTALSVLRRLEEKYDKRAPEPVDNAPEFELFRRGDLLGIFQFAGSQGILEFTKKVAPVNFNDLVAINALYRPGALDSGAAQHYPEWKHKPRKFGYPLVDEILAETFGVICFQEQFMEIFAALQGAPKGDLSDADLARKVLSKARPGQLEWEEKYAKLHAEFQDGCAANGIDDKTTHALWEEINAHTRYSFNKSHSVAYSHVAWEMAWWKYHYPVDFYAATLTVDTANWQNVLFDVVARGIEVVPPHVNESTNEFVSDGHRIYLPLSVVKFLGEAGQRVIMTERPFKDAQDFMDRIPKRSCNGRARLGLFELGAFAHLTGNDPVTLDVKTLPWPSAKERQEEYMGLFLPDVTFLKAIADAEAQGYKAGLVSEVEDRESRFGAYTVYKFLPQGAFWQRGGTKLKIGQEVKMTVKTNSGKILTVAPLR